MLPVDYNDRQKKHTYIFFDFECTQDDRIQCQQGYQSDDNENCIHCKSPRCGAFEHKPNICVVHRVCLKCMDQGVDKDSICQACGKNELVFAGPNTTEIFCQWLFSVENEGATVITHNFKGYDSLPILEYLYQNGVKPTIIANGAKDMPDVVLEWWTPSTFYLAHYRNYLRCLDWRSSRKDISHICSIGKRTNQSYSIIYQTYTTTTRMPWNWKTEKPSSCGMRPTRQRFDFQRELLSYCRSDVDILRRACLTFRQLFLEMTSGDGHGGIDPFQKCITIASACNLVFRTKFLRPDTIGIIPAQGYRQEEKHSIKAMQWIKYLSTTEGVHIQHARNGGKRKLDLIKWMDITKTRTDRNTSWNLTESYGTDVYTVTMPARSTQSMVWPSVIYTNEP